MNSDQLFRGIAHKNKMIKSSQCLSLGNSDVEKLVPLPVMESELTQTYTKSEDTEANSILSVTVEEEVSRKGTLCFLSSRMWQAAR